MYKIMLADDEGIMIDSMKFIIEKEFGSECIVQFAKTGRSVIELAEEFRPDIAIMDIQMPGINGIEAMKEIRTFSKNTIFIVMSAYDKFDYAKEAIKLGVMEYLTKPMEKNKIVAAIRKAMSLIDAEREKRTNELIIKEKLETIEPIIENGFIYNILIQEHFREDIESYKSILGMESNHGYMIAVVFGDEQQGNHMTNAVGSGVKMTGKYKEVREGLKEFFNCYVGAVMANKIAVMVSCSSDKIDYNERIELINRARECARYLKKKTDVSFRIGIGSVKQLTDLNDSYQEALKALVDTTGSVAHADDLPIGCEYEENYPVDLEKKLFEQVEKGDIDGSKVTAGDFFDWMRETNSSNLNTIRLKVLEFVLWAEHLAYENGGFTYQLNSRDNYLPEVLGTNDLDVIKKWFIDKVADASRMVLNKQDEKSESTMEIAKDYIRNNFAKDISLDDVSRKLNISPYYFSKIFKEETGENFIEYVTNIRIDTAKELLMDKTYSMKEICSMCGYSDPNYFSRTFKKNVGVTPTEYRDGKTSEA